MRTLVPLVSLLILAAACGDDDGGGATPDAGGPDATQTPDAGPTPEVVACNVDLAPTGGDTCAVTGGEGPAILLRGDVLAADAAYTDGSVLIAADGTIACVGCDCADAAGFDTAVRVDCPGAAISPGLINPHDHIGFTEGAPIDHGTTRYNHRHGWRGSLSTPSNPNGADGRRWGEVRMVLGGVTTLVGSGNAAGMVRNLDASGNAQEGLDLPAVEFETFPLGDGNETYRADCGWSYKFDELGVAQLDAFLPHVAEGIDSYAADEFYCQSRSTDGAQDFTERNAAHIHSIGLSTRDYDRMARDDTKLIWSPRSNVDLYGVTADVTLFHRLGGTIALGTDWTYSGSIHSVRELACADYLNATHYDGYFTDRELWEMATINAAISLSAQSAIGSLEVGKVADVSVFGGDARLYRAVIEAGATDVALVLRGGVPLYGEAAVVAGLGESCETVDVCGGDRALCAEREFGKTYATLEADVSGAYPAIHCGAAPAGEPTCVPSRPDEYAGPTDGDADGDGIADADDLCPRVFMPLRPIDDGQRDDDGDGIGDACDDTPLASDMDGDRVPNADDNCPYDANPDQADADTDGKGDACDPCPTRPNAKTVCPPALSSIFDIQTGEVQDGTTVAITGVVTGRGGDNITVQTPDADDPAFTGIMVYAPGGIPAGVAIGTTVEVQGRVDEYFDNTEVIASVVTPTGSAALPAPAALSAADAAAEAYEGVYVTITGTVTDATFDCSVTPPCADTNLFELDGASGVLVYDRFFEGAGWPAPAADDTVTVTGVMMYRFDRRRVMPETSADFE